MTGLARDVYIPFPKMKRRSSVTHAQSSSAMYLWKSQRAWYARALFSLGHTLLTSSQSAYKAFRKHIQSHVPGAKIESLRFRSVAFKRSTTAAPAPRTHSLDRTAEWREAKGDGVPTPKPRLSSADKKRIAFIKQDFHEEVITINVYVVFGHGADLPPDEAVKHAIAALDNTQYLDLTLRVDTVGGGKSDPRRTVFVGGLEFASREEDLRVFFEGVICAERGPRVTVPGDSDSDDEEGTVLAKPKTWVKRVRIVRDKDTQLGKGIAYVQFAVRSFSSLVTPG